MNYYHLKIPKVPTKFQSVSNIYRKNTSFEMSHPVVYIHFYKDILQIRIKDHLFCKSTRIALKLKNISDIDTNNISFQNDHVLLYK